MTFAPDRSGMAQRTESRRLIPVSAPISWQSPFEAYQKVYRPNSFLLESVNGPERIARYSIIGLEPHTIFSSKDRKIKLTDVSGERLADADPIEALSQVYGQFKVGSKTHFRGAAAGYLSYDIGRFIEYLPNLAKDDLGLPDSVFLFCSLFIVFDHIENKAEALIMADADGRQGISYRAAQERLKALIKELDGPLIPLRAGMGGRQSEWTSNFTKDQFMKIVSEAKNYIEAGDIYQVNLSQRLATPVGASPLAIYSILRELNPSSFAGFFDFGDWHMVSCSPERLVSLEDRQVQTRPIAGTIRRGHDEPEDRHLRQRLITDTKERAEHIMLVDLERNDLGRVCEYGTVEVDELITTESYSHVTHIVSNVTGKLRRGLDLFDVIRAVFPGGTITGCPKVRAMEIIEELEPIRRGPYTGSMGYLGFNGDMDLNIIIRTLIVKDGLAYVQAGAGIVADSDPEREYYETLRKAEALIQATTLAEERHGCLPT